MRIVSKLTFWGMIFLFSVNAYAGQLDSSGLLDTLLDRFQQVASTWSLVIGDYANWLFWGGNDSNLLIVFYVQIMPDDFVMQLHRF